MLIKNLCEKYFFLIVSFFALLGCLQWNFSKSIFPFVEIMLAIVIFSMALTLDTEDFKKSLSNYHSLFLGLFCQYFFMPLLAFLISWLFNLSSDLAIGMLLVGSCPGGTVSNVMTYIARGDLALSISMTFISTMIAPVMIPSLMYLYAHQWVRIDTFGLLMSTAKVVLLPIIVGLIIKKILKGKSHTHIHNYASLISILFVSLIIHTMVAVNFQKFFDYKISQSQLIVLFLAIIIHNALGYILSYYTAKKLFKNKLEQNKAISIEVGVQNSGLASILAIQFFNPISVIPAILCASWHSISGSALANVWNKKLIHS